MPCAFNKATGRYLRLPSWFIGQDGKCLVGSVEEFALKLAAFGYERPRSAGYNGGEDR